MKRRRVINKKKAFSQKQLYLKIAITVFSTLLLFVLGVSAEDNSNILSVSNIGGEVAPVYVIYWSEEGATAKIERGIDGAYTTLGETAESHFVDYTAKPKETYTYKVTTGGQSLIVSSQELSGGKPEISNIKIEAGATSKTEASVIISFRTDKLSKAQCFYGETDQYSNQTELDQSLNQSHTILIEKLAPQTTYHFKVRAQDKSDTAVTESTDQTFTTATQPSEKTILEIIVEALSKAFSNFESWFRS